MTKEDLEATGKYLEPYNNWCPNHTCDDTCMVWVKRQEYRKNRIIKSCFRTFCELMEQKSLQENNKDLKDNA